MGPLTYCARSSRPWPVHSQVCAPLGDALSGKLMGFRRPRLLLQPLPRPCFLLVINMIDAVPVAPVTPARRQFSACPRCTRDRVEVAARGRGGGDRRLSSRAQVLPEPLSLPGWGALRPVGVAA